LSAKWTGKLKNVNRDGEPKGFELGIKFKKRDKAAGT